jgi:small subunit ribosomal protein S17
MQLDSDVKEKTSSRALIGKVVSDKMDKTVVVKLERKVINPKYKKYQVRFTKLYAHDEKNMCKEGDLVKIKQTRPLSKLKNWEVVEIIT